MQLKPRDHKSGLQTRGLGIDLGRLEPAARTFIQMRQVVHSDGVLAIEGKRPLIRRFCRFWLPKILIQIPQIHMEEGLV